MIHTKTYIFLLGCVIFGKEMQWERDSDNKREIETMKGIIKGDMGGERRENAGERKKEREKGSERVREKEWKRKRVGETERVEERERGGEQERKRERE